MLKYLVSAAWLAVAVAPSLATAPQPGLRTVAVGYDDLDLSRAEGRARLDRRIEAAIRTVCGDEGVQGLASSTAVSRCMAETRAAAHRSLASALAGRGSSESRLLLAAH